jgi:ATP-dependent helicase/nuclease subunit A
MRLRRAVPGDPPVDRQGAEVWLMEPTPQQTAAIQTQGRALVVEAGAGTGKTWVLVERFIHLLREHPDWPIDGLVAVTFTEKATREMRSRIRKAVERQALGAPPNSPWHQRRAELERLQVSTIHGLCSRILRENAIAAGIDPAFEVLDEQEAGFLKEEAISLAISEMVEADSPALDLLAAINVRDLKDEMANLLAKRGVVQRLFQNLPGPEELLEAWERNVQEMRHIQWQEALREDPDFKAALDELGDVPITNPQDKLAPTVALAQKGIALAGAGDRVGAVEAWLDINLGGGRQANWGGKELLVELKAQLGSLRETARQFESSGFLERFGEADQAAAQALQLWKVLWEQLQDAYTQLKGDGGQLDFDDLELLTDELLRQRPRPERLAAFLGGIHHLMVDEFQDTNEIQRDIVYQLAHPEDGGRLFVVGDAKQSIYRFRQAQVAIFNQTIQHVLVATGHGSLPLNRSFRAHAGLVAAGNHLFDQVLGAQGDSYAGYEARPGPLTAAREAPARTGIAPAPVELLLVPSRDEQDENLSAEDARTCEAQLLAQRLLELEAQAFPVWDKGESDYRPFRFSDAAILFRATTSLPLYEEAFKGAGLPYLTVSGRGYYDRPEVQDLIALLTSLHNPADDLSLAAALRSPLFSLSDETLYRLRWHTPEGELSTEPRRLSHVLQNPPPTDQEDQVAWAAGVIQALRRMAGRVTVWQLLREALDRAGFEAALALSGDGRDATSRQLGNVDKLLALARQRGGTSLSAFLRRLDDLRAREAREGEALGSAPESGAVQLMSIHAAKGLEFPVVVVADLGRAAHGGFGSPRILHDPAFGLVCKQRDPFGDWQKPASYRWAEWLDGRMERAESKRLLYVACTRAADLLVLSGKLFSKNSWLGEILDIWGIDLEGSEEDLLDLDGFSLRVLRPGYVPMEVVPAVQTLASSPGLAVMPALARPLPEMPAREVQSVTGFTRAQAEDEEVVPELRPLNPAYDAPEGRPSVPAYQLGDLVHRALANWDCLSLPALQLQVRLAAYARREGFTRPESVQLAVERTTTMIDNLKRSALFTEIQSAAQRLSEVPFRLSTEEGEFHGVIDLLYQDSNGGWHLVDWKTEWLPADQVGAHARQHLSQIELYILAAARALGSRPDARLVFLWPRFVAYTLENGSQRQT